MELTEEKLIKSFDGDFNALGEAIIASDIDVDIEKLGKFVGKKKKVYIGGDGKLCYHVTFYQVKKNPMGEEIERKELTKAASNIATEFPVQWTGKKFPRKEAVKRFVFTRNYQIKHISGLTFDFLYNMAKDLQDTDSLMLVGAGAKGSDPLIITTGGEPYRAFIEGRVSEVDGKDAYILILHLTNIELKGIERQKDGNDETV
jgi:hypothetical protein